MSLRRSLWIIISTLCLMVFLPVVAAAQYTQDDVFGKLRFDGLSRGEVAALVEGMPQGMPVRLEFPEISLSRNVRRNANATAVLEEVFKRIRPKILLADPDWREKLEQTRSNPDNVRCVLKGKWRVEVDGKSQLRELTIELRNDAYDGERWFLVGLRSAPADQ